MKKRSQQIYEQRWKKELGVREFLQKEKQKKTDLVQIGKYRYSTHQILGEGVSSIVYKAFEIGKPREKYAMKVVDLMKYQNREMLDMEVQILMSIRHQNVIQCFDVIKTSKMYYIVLEYCPHGDLEELIKSQKCIPEDRAIDIMSQILDGYKALMSKNVIHRDLKPSNILRFGKVWKIGDFGFSRFCKQQFLIDSVYVGTPLYLPLQSLKLNKYSIKTDIFSLGVIYFYMLFGNTPWQVETEEQLIEQLSNSDGIELSDGNICNASAQFLKQTLQIDFYQRMTKQHLKKFSFKNVNIQKLIKKRQPRGMSPSVKLSKSIPVNTKVQSGKPNTENIKLGNQYYACVNMNLGKIPCFSKGRTGGIKKIPLCSNFKQQETYINEQIFRGFQHKKLSFQK